MTIAVTVCSVQKRETALLVEAQLKMLRKKISWYKTVFPNSDDTAVVDSKAQLSQRHVQLVHSVHTQQAYVCPIVTVMSEIWIQIQW